MIMILSLRLNGDFPAEPGLAGVYWSKGWWRWWWQLDYWSYKSCKAPVKSSAPTNEHPVFLQAGCPSIPVAQPTVSKHWTENIAFHRLAYLKLTWGLPTLSLTTNSTYSNLGGGFPCLSSALWCQYPICDHDCRIKILLRFISFHRRNSVCTSDLLPVIQHSDPKRELRRRNGLPAVPWANEVYTEAWLLLVENGNSGRACMKVNRLNLVNAAQLIYKSIKVWKQTASR